MATKFPRKFKKHLKSLALNGATNWNTNEITIHGYNRRTGRPSFTMTPAGRIWKSRRKRLTLQHEKRG